MKKFLTLLLSASCFLVSAQPHTPAPPPVNPGYNYIRSLHVDCADEIILDAAAGQPLQLQQQLEDYISTNHIGYIVMSGLETTVIGNIVYEAALRQVISDLKTNHPGLQVGVSGSSEAFFTNSAFLKASDVFARKCGPSDYGKLLVKLDSLEKAGGVNAERILSLITFFARAADLTDEGLRSSRYGCNSSFDALFLDYRYWQMSTLKPVVMHEFGNFMLILEAMNMIKCHYSCIDYVDALMDPVSVYTQQGWTATDQITEADFLIDRVVIPSNVASWEYDAAFDEKCYVYHLFSDRFSKKHSKIFTGFDAGSNSFTSCDGQHTGDYLGDYLNGSANPSGNMRSVEQVIVNKLHDPLHLCPQCNCNTKLSNTYAPANTDANEITGSFWFSYSYIQQHQLYRSAAPQSEEKVIRKDTRNMNGAELKDMEGTRDHLPAGVYVEISHLADGRITTRKFVVQ